MSTVTGQAPARGRLPVARRDRRPALAALALLLVLVGALGSALVSYRSGSRVEVLVARSDIELGQEITASDLTTARVAADGGNTIEADALENFVGTRAVSYIPQGTLLNNLMFSGGDIIPDGGQVVGVVVDITRRTTERLSPGDVVQLVYVSGSSGQQGGAVSAGDSVVKAARVIEVGSGGGSGQLSVSVLVPDRDAGLVADLASANSLALTLLPADAEPVVDLAQQPQE
jgi:Flp pilus assembly protein CpaB